MHIHCFAMDDNDDIPAAAGLTPDAAARAAALAGWCWPPIEGEADSEPLAVTADILADHLRDGREALLCSLDGQRFVRLVPTSH